MRRSLIAIALLGVFVLVAPSRVTSADPAEADREKTNQQRLDAYINVVRAGIKTQRTELIEKTIDLDKPQADLFWPIDRRYLAEMDAWSDRRVSLIKEYLSVYDSIDDKRARDLAYRALDLDAERAAMLRRYVDELDRVLPGRKVAQFMQIEMSIERVFDFQIAIQLPLVK